MEIYIVFEYAEYTNKIVGCYKNEEDAKRKKVLTEEEVKTLREGLLKKLEQLKYSYGQITHKKKFDTLVLLRKKEGLEKEMEIIEKDLQRLNNRTVIVDLTK